MRRRCYPPSAATRGLLSATAAVHASEPLPGKSVRLFVPFLAGGFTDSFARIVGAKMSVELLTEIGALPVECLPKRHQLQGDCQ